MLVPAEQPDPGSNRVLLVDDDPVMLRLLSAWLERAGYRVRQVSDGRQALEAVEAECPDFLVTDWDMPHVDGLELCRRVRGLDLPHYVFILFLTTKRAPDETIAGLDVGADEFVSKPIHRAELLARMRAGSRVLQLERQLRELAHSDPLTGLPTRRVFFEGLAREWERARRLHLPISCVMVDIDFFKRVNDLHGHAVGDGVLKAVAGELAAGTRKSDLVCRYGGEELLLLDADERDGMTWSQRCGVRIAGASVLAELQPIAVTASFGVSARRQACPGYAALLNAADQALLAAKRSGRNRAVAFSALEQASLPA